MIVGERLRLRTRDRRYTSQSLTAGTLWFAGDILSQRLTWPQEEPKTKVVSNPLNEEQQVETSDKSRPFGLASIDWGRAAIMTSFGLFIAGPLYTFWYRLLDEKMVHIVAKWVCPLLDIRKRFKCLI
jgi:hypothetical protein